MRQLDCTLTPADGIHPVDSVIASHPAVTREALVHINALWDGTGILLYRLCGDSSALSEALNDTPDVLTQEEFDVQGDVFHLYLHVRPGEPAGTLMALVQQYALIIETPLVFTDRGRLRVTVAGTHTRLQQAMAEIPATIHLCVDQVSQYSPDCSPPLSRPTERQVEVLRTAVEHGYYDIPRQVTHADIAHDLDCAPSTIDEHLRKAESSVFSSFIS